MCTILYTLQLNASFVWYSNSQCFLLIASPSAYFVPRLTGYGIHHCFARSMIDQDAEETTMFHNFYAEYYTMAGIAVASCLALCPAVGLMGRRGGLLLFMIITALASLLQLGLLNCEYLKKTCCVMMNFCHR